LAKEQFCSRSQAGACVKLFQQFEVDNSLAASNTGVPFQLFWDFKKISARRYVYFAKPLDENYTVNSAWLDFFFLANW